MDVNLLVGHSVRRTHWFRPPRVGEPRPVSLTILSQLKSWILARLLEKDARLFILKRTKALRLITNDDGDVIGVETMTEGQDKVGQVLGDAVVLATGGFSNDRGEDSLLKEFAPSTLSYPTTNGPFATGSGVKMARAIGAKLIDMDKVQLHPTGFVDPKNPSSFTKFLAAEALRGMGGILLDHEGKRFANESGTRDYLTQQILEKCGFNETAKAHTAYLIMNDAVAEKFGWPAFNFYWKVKGFFQKVQGVVEFAEAIGVNVAVVRETFRRYDLSAQANNDEFGKTSFPVVFDPDEFIYFSTITPCIDYTMGGLEIDSQARVLRQSSNRPIPGLFAAGEVTGGVHGDGLLEGNEMLESVVFGKIAGSGAFGDCPNA